MKTYDIKIRISTETPDECQQLGNLLQNSVNMVNTADLIKLLTKLKNNPGLVKTALKWI
jgi:hypothetical protein